MRPRPDPGIEHPGDAIVRVTSTAICSSDLHLYDAFIPGMKSGDIMGHEFMGEVVEVGSENQKLKVGNRVVASLLKPLPAQAGRFPITAIAAACRARPKRCVG